MRGIQLLIVLALLSIVPIAASGQRQAQPQQISSPIKYNARLSHRFFRTEKFSLPWWIIDNEDGTVEDMRGEITDIKDAPRLRHTAACRTAHQGEHEINFAEAKLIDPDSLEITIHDESASTTDTLKITVKAGHFSCQYSTLYPGDRGDEGLIWTTTKQHLILNQKSYQHGDQLKGSIEFQCLQQITNAKYPGNRPRTIRITGVFKPVVE